MHSLKHALVERQGRWPFTLAPATNTGLGRLLLALHPLQGLINGIAHAAVLPGGGGSAELGGGQALAFFLPTPQVIPAVLLWRLFTFHWNIFLGGLVLPAQGLLLAKKLRKARAWTGCRPRS